MGGLNISINDVRRLGGNPGIESRGDLLGCAEKALADPVAATVVSEVFLGAPTAQHVSVDFHDRVGVRFQTENGRDVNAMRAQQFIGFLGSLSVDGDVEKRTSAVLDLENTWFAKKPRVVVQGGHRISAEEYDFLRHVFWEFGRRVKQATVITGCGDGAMEAPFAGLELAIRDRMFKASGWYFNVGLTELGILAKERPNRYVERLVVYPNIEQRMEAFVRLATLLVFVPGGVGTAEEIMQLIEIVLYGGNRKHSPEAHLIERADGIWMAALQDLFASCFPDMINSDKSPFKMFPGIDPAYYSSIMKGSSRRFGHTAWNENIDIPKNISSSISTKDPGEFLSALEDMRFSRSEYSDFQLAGALRIFFSAMVDLTVRNPQIPQQWKEQGQKVRLHGQQKVISALMRFTDVLYSQNRLSHGCATREEMFAA